MVIEGAKLLLKEGGRSGTYRRRREGPPPKRGSKQKTGKRSAQ
jgi:hypothetical protein